MSRSTTPPFVLPLIFVVALSAVGAAEDLQNDQVTLKQRIRALESNPKPTVDGAPIAALPLISALYERREYRGAWTEDMVRELFDQVLRSVEHGLNPEDFHARYIGGRLHLGGTLISDPTHRAGMEILCTDALARLAMTLKFGKLDPSDLFPAWNFDRSIETQEPVELLNEVLNGGKIAIALENTDPEFDVYDALKKALVEYRSIMGAGGWTPVPEGPILKLDSTGPRVAALRTRLRLTGDLESTEPSARELYDQNLEAGVKHFQVRHGLDPDGKVGPKTLMELNAPVDLRINQIRASLERTRWVARDLGADFVIADIAGFRAHLFQDGERVWSTRIQVGKPFHATPVFKDSMRYVDFNPTWTIPPGILRKEILPKVRKDPSYLSRNSMSVVTTSGKIVDPSTIDWPATVHRFPYMIRQEPGPHNALGRVKFMFPNKYMVYLHDTPSKGLFARAERAFSHGCIRTENPFELAELILGDQGWDRERIDEVIASKKTTRVNLKNPLPVMLLYWTAEADAEGTVFFRRDLYDRDGPIVRGLDEPFRLSPPDGAAEALTRVR